jgi:XTP/dITP diphosphohydrolase
LPIKNPSLNKLLIATGNRHKFKEIEAILGPLPLELLSLETFPDFQAPEETGQTYLENALLKAKAAAQFSDMVTLAEDSGLEVDALAGAPGIWSARFSGLHGDTRGNIARLLELLEAVPESGRTARFRCLAVLYHPKNGWVDHTEGVCEGSITRFSEGDGGFGYDPVFFLEALEAYGKTMAQIPAELKNRISHRALALGKIKDLLPRYFPEVFRDGS